MSGLIYKLGSHENGSEIFHRNVKTYEIFICIQELASYINCGIHNGTSRSH